MRVVKSISLPVHLAEKAKEFDNLSMFVQDCIAYGIENNAPNMEKRIQGLRRQNFDLNDIIEELTDYLCRATNSKQLPAMLIEFIANVSNNIARIN